MCHVIDVTSHSVTTQVAQMDSKKAEPKADTEPEETTSSLEESDIEKCFHTSRFPSLPWSLLLLLYAPLGLFLTLLRVCMSLQAILILTLFPEGAVKRFLLRVFFGVLGIVVITDSFHRKSSQTKVFVSNRVSYVDHIVLHLALDCVTLSTRGRAPSLHFLFPHRKLSSTGGGSGSGGGGEGLEAEAKQLLTESDESRALGGVSPLVVQPEPIPTNGSHSLLKFSEWPFSLAPYIQPIALTAKRPFGIKLTTVHSSQWWDLLWTLFLPTTVFHVKLLPPMERREGEDASKFAERARDSLGEELQLRRSQFTMDDVQAWLEACRKKALEVVSISPTSPPPAPPTGGGLERMVEQVSAVMPQVPCSAIRRDLLRTQSVDATITNLLEGVVAYDPLPPSSQPPAPITHSHHSSLPRPPSSSASATTPSLKSTDLRPRKYYSPAMETMHRQLSLEERKARLIHNARKWFIEKHGLNVEL